MKQYYNFFMSLSIIITLISSISFANNIINTNYKEIFITVKRTNYKIIFTNKGGAIKGWALRESNGQWFEVLNQRLTGLMSNFDNCIYRIVSVSNNNICFEYISPLGWKITKTYYLSNYNNMHNLTFSVEKVKPDAKLPTIEFKFDSSSLLSPNKSVSDNILKVFTCSQVKPNKVKILKNSKVLSSPLYKWIAFSNRYFVYALIPSNPTNFNQIKVLKSVKPLHYYIKSKINDNNVVNKFNYSLSFFLGPKHYKNLKSYNLNLEKVVNFGLFSFIGKPLFLFLIFLHSLIGNYGWAIIILTIIMQLLLLPLTLKSFKSLMIMKRIQPQITNIQQQYSNDAKRAQIEILNIYKTQQINPLGGCLPTLLQLPIFWAFFTILRNVYELRNERWILWIRDLSLPDQFINIGGLYIHLLPIIMGLVMFLQQKITTVAPTAYSYKKMMYIMPILFTLMFWSFPSGLIIYWIVNSTFALLEQYYILKK